MTQPATLAARGKGCVMALNRRSSSLGDAGDRVDETEASETSPEEQLLERLVLGEQAAFETLMRSHNQRLFRVARAIVLDDAEAEDAVQASYLAAFLGISRFEGRSSLATWLTRIVIHEAFARRRARLRAGRLYSIEDVSDELAVNGASPEESVSLQELTRLTESAIDGLPPTYRVVLVLRQVQGLSGPETAASLGVSEQVVRVRLHRARSMLRELLPGVALGAPGVKPYGFDGERCTRIVERVLLYAFPPEARVLS